VRSIPSCFASLALLCAFLSFKRLWRIHSLEALLVRFHSLGFVSTRSASTLSRRHAYHCLYDSHDHTLLASFGFLYISFVQLASVWRTCSVGMRGRMGNGGFHSMFISRKSPRFSQAGKCGPKSTIQTKGSSDTIVRSTTPANSTCTLCVTSELRCINLIDTIMT
jgi:hypothetical protein